jgi:flagellar biogenesis protein FliO
VFTARVNALAGLGQLVTVMALLLLAVWWIHHFRRRHRERQNLVTDTTRRHPSGDTPRQTPDDPNN